MVHRLMCYIELRMYAGNRRLPWGSQEFVTALQTFQNWYNQRISDVVYSFDREFIYWVGLRWLIKKEGIFLTTQ